MTWNVWVRLCAMMFLQYFIWGAWAPVLSAYLEKQLGFSPMQSAWVYSLFPLMCIISPFAGGQLADRYFSTQRVLGVLHIVGGICLLLMGKYTSFQHIMTFMLVYSIVYTPTLALTNSICFHHMANSERDFGKIRVWGTLGWIIVGWVLSLMRNCLPAIQGDCLFVSGIAAAGMGVFCFFLPNTPPKKVSESPWAFLKAFTLFKDKSFVIFMAISFVVVTELQFYYLLTAPFLQDIGVKAANVPAWMTLAQLAEILTMAWALPYLLPKTGVRWALAVITLGVGSFIGMHFAGLVKDLFTAQGVTHYTGVFLVPCVLTVACAAAFLIWFRPAKADAATP